MRLLILGPPGAGKGTQAAKIKDDLRISHISTGDIFRKNIKEQTDLGKKVSAYLDEGKLVPDDLTIEMLWDRLDEDDTKDGFLLDGFPRTIPQAESLEKGLKERNIELDQVINIDVPADVLVRRLSGRRVCKDCSASYHVDNNPPRVENVCDVCGGELVQRVDDTEETVKNRIQVYEDQTAPLIDFYESRSLLKSFDGTQDIDKITKDILDALKG